MSRNRFEKIHQYLHFNDNMKIDPIDRVYKAKPLFDHLNTCFRQLIQPLCKSYSLDEAIKF